MSAIKVRKDPIITSLIDQYLITKPEHKRSKGFHPSSIGYCSRRIAFAMQQYLPNKFPTAIDERKFKTGHAIEGMYDDWFDAMDAWEKKKPGTFNGFKLIEKNTFLSDKELDVKGELDKIIEVNGIKYLTDIKSMKDSDYGKSHIPYEGHMKQVLIYCYIKGVPNGCLIYENKNTHDQYEFHFELTEEVFNEIKSKIKYIEKCNKTNKLPKRECKKGSMDCNFCPYEETCWESQYSV